jgi:CRP-like cAMP-binding protein
VSVNDFLDTKRKEIADRLAELKPLVDEYQRLEAASAALEGLGNGTATRARSRARAAAARRAPARRAPAPTAGAGRRGRPRGSGTRGLQALELVRARPGITIPEMAAEMGIKQNYLYRVLPGLQRDGQVRKQGRGWHPKQAA